MTRPRDGAAPSRPGVLSGPRRFARVRAWRAQRSAGVIRVAAAPNPLGTVRVGFAIGAARSAVIRNRVRRRLRAAAAPLLVRHPGHDFVISAGPSAALVPYNDLARDLAAAVDAVVVLVARRAAEVR